MGNRETENMNVIFYNTLTHIQAVEICIVLKDLISKELILKETMGDSMKKRLAELNSIQDDPTTPQR